MNSRQRRGIILLLLSVLCALGAFAGVISVISDVNSKVGPEVSAYRLKTDVSPYTPLRPDQFEKISMPRRWLSDSAVTDLSVVNGKIAVTQLRKGSLLQDDMIVKRPVLASGEQEIAIMIDAATGVAGKITPGDLVNIFATFAGKDEGDPDQSRIIVPNAKVIDVGRLTAARTQGRQALQRPARGRADHLRAQHHRRPARRVRRVLRRACAPRASRQGQPGHIAPR